MKHDRNNPFEPEILRLGDLESLQQSNYKSFLPTKMVAHGYNGDPGTFNSTKNGNLFSFFLRHCQLLDPLSKRTKIPPNTTAFLRRENCNFITIDWTELASGFDYPLIVVRNIPLAASEIGYVNIIKTQYLSSTRTMCVFVLCTRNLPSLSDCRAFVEFLCENTGASLKSFHLIGFSLGAHVAGGAGAAIGSGKVFRITGKSANAHNGNSRQVTTLEG